MKKKSEVTTMNKTRMADPVRRMINPKISFMVTVNPPQESSGWAPKRGPTHHMGNGRTHLLPFRYHDASNIQVVSSGWGVHFSFLFTP
jgi:hypothetical protein